MVKRICENYKCNTFSIKACSEDFTTCKRRILDLILKIAYGEGKVDYFSKIFNEIKKIYGDHPDFDSDIVDIFWLADNVADGDSDISKEKLVQLIGSVKSEFPEQLLIERLSEDILEACSIISSKNSFSTKYVRTKTRLFYKQKKFNLLREENEGYAKCITILATKNIDAFSIMNHLRCLIGYFDLDPNRVINLILDSCEHRTSHQNFYVELLRLFSPDKTEISHFLGHKFSMSESEDGENSSNLYRLSALLITAQLASLDKLLPHLKYKDSVILQNYEKQMTLARSYKPMTSSFANPNSTSINQSLNDFGYRDNDRHHDEGHEPVDRDRSSNHLQSANEDSVALPHQSLQQQQQQQQTSLQVSSILDESLVIEEIYLAQIHGTAVNKKTLYHGNQKLGLIVAFLKFGDWSNAQRLLDAYPGYWAVAYRPVGEALCQLIHYLSEELYEKHNNLTSNMTKKRNRYTSLDYNLKDDQFQANRLKPATTFEDWGKHVLPLVGYLGPYLSQDINLLVKLCRLSAFYLQHKNNENRISPLYQSIFNVLDESILPSLSLVEANCCLTEEVWNLLSLMPFDHRYRLYGQWLNVAYGEDPFLIKRKAESSSKIRAILKRLSKENTKVIGRQLGKLSHSNPCLIFEIIIQTLQIFSNLIEPIVECLKYVSSLSYDVLTYCIISSLASDKEKLEDFQLSQSLQATATFTGILCKKYQFDLTGIFSYVNTQLHANQSYDLIVLREIILKMTGVDTSEEITDEQLEAFNGGDLLLQEGAYYSQIRNTRRNASRLADALMQQKLVMPLLIGMSKMRDHIIYKQELDQPVKLTGKLYDQCLGTMIQFITFLNLQISRDDLTSQLMPIEKMLFEYNLPPDTTFFLFRSVFEQRVYQAFEKECKLNPSKSTLEVFINTSDAVTSEIAKILSAHDKQIICPSISYKIYTIFWCLSLGDLSVPTAAYTRQINLLKTQQVEVNKHSDWTAGKRKKESDRLQSLIEKLQKEQVQRTDHVKRIHAWLESDKEKLFSKANSGKEQPKSNAVSSFLQNCILPRVYLSSSDAIYAAEFMIFLHKMKTPNFSTLICFDQIFNQMPQLITLATENEAHRFGRFLCTILFHAMQWHSSAKIYNSLCVNSPGFLTALKKNTSTDKATSNVLEYENYRHVAHKWHYCLTKFFVSSLESGNSTQIRNALIVLTRILPHYPRIITFGNALERRLKKLKDDETDKRPDLKTLALRCIGLLRPRHSTWIAEKDFHHIEKELEGGPVNNNNKTINNSNTPGKTSTTSTSGHANNSTTNGTGSTTNPTRKLSANSSNSGANINQSSTTSSSGAKNTNNNIQGPQSRSRESTASSSLGGSIVHHHHHHHHHGHSKEMSDNLTPKSASNISPARANAANNETSFTTTTITSKSSDSGPIKKRRIHTPVTQESHREVTPSKNETLKSTSPAVTTTTTRKASSSGGGHIKKREDSLSSSASTSHEVPPKKSRQSSAVTGPAVATVVTSKSERRAQLIAAEESTTTTNDKRSSRSDHKAGGYPVNQESNNNNNNSKAHQTQQQSSEGVNKSRKIKRTGVLQTK